MIGIVEGIRMILNDSLNRKFKHSINLNTEQHLISIVLNLEKLIKLEKFPIK